MADHQPDQQPDRQPDQRGPVLFVVLLLIAALIVVAWGAGHPDALQQSGAAAAVPPARTPSAPSSAESSASTPTPSPTDAPSASAPARPVPTLPGGGTRVFEGNRFLVAYYGTAGTPALGVLGESPPDVMDRRLRRAARPFARPGQPVRPVYELIVTVADAYPGKDGDYSHDVRRADVARYVRAAHRNGALLVLDLQPGRSSFPTVARRWAWALRYPGVGLALDPEWRMTRHQVPARTVGQVGAAEVNRTAAWLSAFTRQRGLPEKLFVLHQFRRDMVHDIGRIRRWPGLAMVQHVDGFGTRHQKRATYAAVARPSQFTMGFKLFYDEDVHRMGPRAVHALRPRVRFISFQ